MSEVPPAERQGDELAVLGKLHPTGARVVLWDEPGAYNAYEERCHFTPERIGPSQSEGNVRRYGPLRRNLPDEIRERVETGGWILEDLQKTIRQVVIHYDACGTSRQCFKVLHDIRGLSCHFLLDLDGTIYQTLDLKERAWHAGVANDFSVGIEIAHPGAFGRREELDSWYRDAGDNLRLVLPDYLGDGGLPGGFVASPARSGLYSGTINKRALFQRDFTEAQYSSLERLLAALCRLFPRIERDVPRDSRGEIRREAFSSKEDLLAYRGLLGHYHVAEQKYDPGPGFDWERVLAALQRDSP